MPVVLQSNTATGLNTLTVSTSTNLTGASYTPTRETGNISTVVSNTTFVDTNATRPRIDYIGTNGSNSLIFLSDGKLFECHGTSGNDNYTSGRNIVNQSYVTGIDRASQIPIPDTSPVVKAWVAKHGMALCANGNLYTWGYNGYGQLGLGTTTSMNSPTLSATNVVDFYTHVSQNCGYYMYDAKSIIKKGDGYLYGCGYNGYGQLGIAGNTSGVVSTWTQIPDAGTNPLFVGNFGNSYGKIVIQKSDKTIWMAGYNGYGTFGNGTTVGANPSLVNVTSNWNNGNNNMLIKQLAGGSGYVAGGAGSHVNLVMLLDDGTTTIVKTAGANNWATLGTGDTTNRYTAFQPTLPSGRVSKIVSSADSVGALYILMQNGNLYANGYNGYGQTGHGDTTDRLVPTLTNTAVLDVYNSVEYNYGHYHSQFIKKADGLYAAGYNGNSHLGVGDTTNRSSWTKVWLPHNAGLNVKDMGCFSTTGTTRVHVALTTNNTLYAWGYNSQYAIFPWNGGQVRAPCLVEIFRGD
jgi:alpha-tubulin suppressor-like RCC1 family protein